MKKLILLFIVGIFTLNSCNKEITGKHNNAIVTGKHNTKNLNWSVINPRDLEGMNIRRVQIKVKYKNKKSILNINVLKKEYKETIELLMNDTLVTNIKAIPIK